ncbi:MAG TPA: DMT family transporter [Bdellovibrionota bacterium]|jgi:inner membrane transporter RhtA|nr:DMT family transporter [Bdellovibrionota bacterium]
MVAIVCVLVAVLSIQVGASFAKQLFPLIGPTGTTSLRLFFAALMLLAVWRPWRQRYNREQIGTLLIYGVSLGAMNLLFYLALERIPLGIAVALEFTGPLSLALLNSKNLRDLVWVACAVSGIVLVLPVQSSSLQANLDPLGILLALAAGACWATYIRFGQRAGSQLHGGYTSAIGMSVAALVIAPLGFLSAGGASLWRPDVLPAALGVALLSSALPYSLEMVALKRLSTHTFSILMSLEPAAAALSGFLFLDETLSPKQLLAIALIMIASAGCSFSLARARQNLSHE